MQIRNGQNDNNEKDIKAMGYGHAKLIWTKY